MPESPPMRAPRKTRYKKEMPRKSAATSQRKRAIWRSFMRDERSVGDVCQDAVEYRGIAGDTLCVGDDAVVQDDVVADAHVIPDNTIAQHAAAADADVIANDCMGVDLYAPGDARVFPQPGRRPGKTV